MAKQRRRSRRRVLRLDELTLRQYMVLEARPPMYRPADLVEATGLPQPRVSEVLRGVRIYPKALERIRLLLQIDQELLDALIENSRQEAERGRS